MHHTTIYTNNAISSKPILGDFIKADNSPVLYRGIGHVVDDTNVLAIKVL